MTEQTIVITDEMVERATDELVRRALHGPDGSRATAEAILKAALCPTETSDDA
jgi:hypothetical protein